MYMYLEGMYSEHTKVPTKARGVRYPKAGVPDGCEPPDMGTGNQTGSSARADSTLNHRTNSLSSSGSDFRGKD